MLLTSKTQRFSQEATLNFSQSEVITKHPCLTAGCTTASLGFYNFTFFSCTQLDNFRVNCSLKKRRQLCFSLQYTSTNTYFVDVLSGCCHTKIKLFLVISRNFGASLFKNVYIKMRPWFWIGAHSRSMH